MAKTANEDITKYFQDYVKFTHAIDYAIQKHLGEDLTQEELEDLYSVAVENAMELDLRLHFLRDSEDFVSTLHDYCHDLRNLLDIDFIQIEVNPHEIRFCLEGCPYAPKFHYRDPTPQVCPIALIIAMVARKYFEKRVRMRHSFNEKGVRCTIYLEEE